jgi:hypothetical protein
MKLDHQRIINNLVDNGYTQSEIARTLDLSRQRVNQIINKQAHTARYKVNYAVKTGKIIKPKECSECNQAKRLEAHHPDHSKPYDIVWLCKPCHMEQHTYNTSGDLIKDGEDATYLLKDIKTKVIYP